jgi:hydroxyacylglutathione hydrolase
MPSTAIHMFPCLTDNYGFLVHDGATGETACIDTPDSQRILEEARARGWKITQIWNTHWHPDHAGGNLAIKEATGCTVVGPRGEAARIPGIDRPLGDGDIVKLGALEAKVIDTPGHTAGHIGYYLPQLGSAFVGDTLFALGCGRLFEGTAAQMWASLSRIAALPDKTRIYCAHEYTAANAAFAITVDPGNGVLQERTREIRALREAGRPTVPTTLGVEKASNPFLRADDPALQEAMGHAGDTVATFAEIRGRKDKF